MMSNPKFYARGAVNCIGDGGIGWTPSNRVTLRAAKIEVK